MKANSLGTLNPFHLYKSIFVFFARLMLLSVLWISAYHFILHPLRVPDRFLTNITTGSVTGVINIFSHRSALTWISSTSNPLAYILQGSKTVLVIYDDCNGLNLLVIYLSMIILLPYSAKRKIGYGVGGILLIIAGNIIRCLSLYWIYIHFNSSFDFNHHYVFTLLMYLLILFCWLSFTKTKKLNETG